MGYILPISLKTHKYRYSKIPLNAKVDAVNKTKHAKVSYRSQPKFKQEEFSQYFGQFIDSKV